MDRLVEVFDYLGVRLSKTRVPDMVREIDACVNEQRMLTVSYATFYTTNVIGSDEASARLFDAFDIVTPEGIAVISTAWLFGTSLSRENILSAEYLMPPVYQEAIQQGWGIYLLGGEPGIALSAGNKLENAFPGLKIVGTHHGILGTQSETDGVVEDINQSGASILMVGMGQPRQEEWIIQNKDRLKVSFIIAIGGYFDKVDKRVDCYPKWVFKLRLFWVYRLVTEPRRVWKRYTFGVLRFLGHLISFKLSK